MVCKHGIKQIVLKIRTQTFEVSHVLNAKESYDRLVFTYKPLLN